MEVAIISVTKQGDLIADKIGNHIKIKLFSKYRNKIFNLKEVIEEVMNNFKFVIFISSTGIAVRSISPFLKSKKCDPAVVVIDCTGKFVISLLSGHLGGANELTLKIAQIIDGEAVITTASDNLGYEAPDMIAKANGLLISDFDKAKEVAAILVQNGKVAFIDEENLIPCPKKYCQNEEEVEGVIYVTNKLSLPTKDKSPVLKLIRKNIVIGIGCRKNYPSEKLFIKVREAFKQHNLDMEAIKTITTVEVKKDEEAIIKLSEILGCNLDIWSIDEIKTIEHKFPISQFVKKTIGVGSVCEPSVELSGGEIIVNKLPLDGMTLCIGKYRGEKL